MGCIFAGRRFRRPVTEDDSRKRRFRVTYKIPLMDFGPQPKCGSCIDLLGVVSPETTFGYSHAFNGRADQTFEVASMAKRGQTSKAGTGIC